MWPPTGPKSGPTLEFVFSKLGGHDENFNTRIPLSAIQKVNL